MMHGDWFVRFSYDGDYGGEMDYEIDGIDFVEDGGDGGIFLPPRRPSILMRR